MARKEPVSTRKIIGMAVTQFKRDGLHRHSFLHEQLFGPVKFEFLKISEWADSGFFAKQALERRRRDLQIFSQQMDWRGDIEMSLHPMNGELEPERAVGHRMLGFEMTA